MRINLGEPFRESALKEGIARLEDTLHTEGLYQATVDYTLEPQTICAAWTSISASPPATRANRFHRAAQPDQSHRQKTSEAVPASLGKALTSERLDHASTACGSIWSAWALWSRCVVARRRLRSENQ